MNEEDQKKIEKREQETLNEIQEELKRIAKLGPALTEADKAFIRARVSYLSGDQKEMWAEVLEEKSDEGEPSLMDLTRKELEEKAMELGIEKVSDKKVFPTKDALVSAIEEKSGEGEE